MSDVPFGRSPAPAGRPRPTATAIWARLLAALDAREAPTWGVIALAYGGFAVMTWRHEAIPLYLLLPAGAYLLCLQAHLTHEILHGHPTRTAWVNELFAWPPLSLWLPYPIYRDSHLAHHRVGALTCPIEDPESFYQTPAAWARKPAAVRAVLTFNQSFLGRMVVGPALMAGRFWSQEIGRFAAGERAYLRTWLVHLALAGAVLLWVGVVCGMPIWLYLAGMVYPSMSLGLMRSFVEHRPGADQDARCAVVEGGPLTRLLFLNNNYHLIHHSRPGLRWYKIPAAWRADPAEWLARNGGYHYRDYLQVARRHFLRAKDVVVHPTPR